MTFITIRVLGSDESRVLTNVAPGVFDHAIDARWCAEFFAVAVDGDQVVGMASGVRYVHPDKPPELWINEVGVADTHRSQGLGRRLLAALLERGVALGCVEAWVLTSPTNDAAQRMYIAVGGTASDEPSVMFSFPLRERAREG